MPKVSLAKWGFTICRAKKFFARRAWIFLAVDGITVTRGELTCTHVCTYIGVPLYISANLIPFLFALWEEMDTPRSLVSRAFAGSELKEHHFLGTNLSFLYEPTCVLLLPPFCVRIVEKPAVCKKNLRFNEFGIDPFFEDLKSFYLLFVVTFQNF